MALASMGIYVFETRFLFEQLRRDAEDPASKRDFGGDIIPHIVKHGKAVAHRFTSSCIRAAEEIEEYWRDVGTIDAGERIARILRAELADRVGVAGRESFHHADREPRDERQPPARARIGLVGHGAEAALDVAELRLGRSAAGEGDERDEGGAHHWPRTMS